MSRKKTIIVISIAGIIITILIVLGIMSYKSKKVKSIATDESNTNTLQEENVVIDDNTITKIETKNTEAENEIIEDKKIDEDKNAEIEKQVVQEKTVQESTKKEINTESTNKSQGTTTDKKITQTNEDTNKQTQVNNNSQTQTSTSQNNNSDDSYTEKEVQVAPKTECVGNNHKMESGNTGKWFETKNEADSYYDNEIQKWGNMWENGEITKEEYLKKCPSGYEVWTCPQCQKWTLNFYYR